MSEESVELGHATAGGLRVDGLQNVLTGMGTARDKSRHTTAQPIVFLAQEELEALYGEWLPRRIVDIYAEQSTRKGFKVLFGGEGAKAEEVTGVEQVIEDLYILENLMLASKNSRLYGGEWKYLIGGKLHPLLMKKIFTITVRQRIIKLFLAI